MYNEAYARAVIADQARQRELSLRHVRAVNRSSTRRARPGALRALVARWFGPRPSTDERPGTLVLVPVVAVEMRDAEMRPRRS
jgi:hypothetical protein